MTGTLQALARECAFHLPLDDSSEGHAFRVKELLEFAAKVQALQRAADAPLVQELEKENTELRRQLAVSQNEVTGLHRALATTHTNP